MLIIVQIRFILIGFLKTEQLLFQKHQVRQRMAIKMIIQDITFVIVLVFFTSLVLTAYKEALESLRASALDADGNTLVDVNTKTPIFFWDTPTASLHLIYNQRITTCKERQRIIFLFL